MDELSRKRWDSAQSANDIPPVMALEALLDDMKSGAVAPEHVVVVWEDEGGHIRYNNSGNLRRSGVVGMLERAKHSIIHGGTVD